MHRLLIWAGLVLGCSPYQLRDRQLERKLERHAVHSTLVEVENGTVHLWRGGEGRPLVFLQGFGADAKWQWHTQAPAFLDAYDVLMPDMLFFGESTTDRAERSIVFQAETVVQLLDHHGLDQVDLIGASYGGMVAWALAAQWPERVRRVVIVDSPGNAYEAADAAQLMAEFELEDPAELVIPERPQELRRLMKAAYHPPPPVPGFVVRDAYRHVYATNREPQRELIADLMGWLEQPPDALPGITQPTLLIWGRHDRIFPVDIAQRLKARMGDQVQLHIIEGGAHAPNLDNPKEFNGVARAFLDEP